MNPDDTVGEIGPEEKAEGRTELYVAVGRITILGTALEDTAYSIAEALKVDGARTQPARRTLDQMRDRVRTSGVPPWTTGGITAAQVLSWIREAKAALSGRHDIVHATYHRAFKGDAWVEMRASAAGRKPAREVQMSDYARVTRDLKSAYDAGQPIRIALIPELAPGIRMPIFGPSASVPVVVWDPRSRIWPARPTDEQLQRWKAEWLERHMRRTN